MNVFISARQREEMADRRIRDYGRCLYYRFCRLFKVNGSAEAEVLAEYLFIAAITIVGLASFAVGCWIAMKTN